MKKIFLLCLLAACTQKYSDYDLIRKADFMGAGAQTPVPNISVMPRGKDEVKECFHQWLFFSNAEKMKQNQIPQLVRFLCPREDFLMKAEFTETWWTTIFYTQSCIKIQTLCGELRPPL